MVGRKIPNLEKGFILFPLIGKKKATERNYIKAIEKFETNCEKSTIETLGKIGITGLVKTDRYSLPYKNEVVMELAGESYLNGAYEFYRAIRPFIKELLNKELNKIRFYIYIEVQDPRGHFFMGSIKYHFRYYEHY